MLLRRSRNLYAYTEARLSKRIGAALAAPTLCRMSIMLSLLLSMLLLFLLRLLLVLYSTVVLLLLLPLLRLLPAVLSLFSSTRSRSLLMARFPDGTSPPPLPLEREGCGGPYQATIIDSNCILFKLCCRGVSALSQLNMFVLKEAYGCRKNPRVKEKG